jgi:hypothetical protein
MMGNRKLSTIRNDLRKAMASEGSDPIVWLEQQIAKAKREGRDDEVLESLKRVLDETPKKARRRRSIRSKK